MNNPSKIITHTAVSSKRHTAQDVDMWHKDRWLGFVSHYFKNKKGEPYHVGYHYVIEWDGKIVQCRDHSEEGAHCIGMNTRSIGVCFMGDGDKHLPSAAQIASWKKLYKKIRMSYPQLEPGDCVPHRRYANKSCHGRLLPDNYFANLLTPKSEDTQLKIRQLMEIIALLRNILSLKQKQK